MENITEHREKWEQPTTWFPLICRYTCVSLLLPGLNLRPSVIWIIIIWMWKSSDHVLLYSSSWRSDVTGKNSLSTHAPQPCWRSENKVVLRFWWRRVVNREEVRTPPVFLSPQLFWHSFGLAGIHNKYWGKKKSAVVEERELCGRLLWAIFI